MEIATRDHSVAESHKELAGGGGGIKMVTVIAAAAAGSAEGVLAPALLCAPRNQYNCTENQWKARVSETRRNLTK